MKKSLIIISLILLIVVVICIFLIKITTGASKAVLNENSLYEQYLEDTIYGTDVVSIINKAISNNENNDITKDEKGLYINNGKNSITIDLVMITDEEKQETTTYKMETIYNYGMTKFIKNFNTAEFKCTKKEYHEQTGRIAYIELAQQN